MQTDAFATSTDDNSSANPLSLLVGEGKKFKSVEDLAKGKLEADRFIEQLLREKAEQQETLTRLTTEAQVTQETTPTNTKSKVGEDVGQPKAADLKSLVQQTIQDLFAERETQNNVVEVNKKLQATFGDKAADMVAQRASELNVGVEFLRSVAAKSPAAFYKLLDTTGSAPSGSVAQSTVTMPIAGETKTARTWTDYMAMKKANPKLYHSPEIQREIFMAKRDGRLVIPS